MYSHKRSGGGGSVLIQSQRGSSSNSLPLDAPFLSGPSDSPLLGSRSMVSFEDVRLTNGSNKGQLFYLPFDHHENGVEDFDDDPCFHQPEKKRRLTVDQVQFLEKSFELENKLEPQRKFQLAKELGLEPRQVAIWFQNRRARWRTKQLEKDYDVLQNSYNCLKADYDNLLKKNEELKAEVLLLADKLQAKEKKESHNRELPAELDKTLSQEEPSHTQNPAADSAATEGEVCKDIISSAKSDVLDSDSPHNADGVPSSSSLPETGDSSYVFEPEQSDLSQDEDDNLSKNVLLLPYVFHKLEEAEHYSDPPTSSCNFGFPIEEDHQAFWSWSF